MFVAREQDRFNVRPVEVGRRIKGEAEIVHGLDPGDRIVVRGSFLVKSELLKSTLGEAASE